MWWVLYTEYEGRTCFLWIGSASHPSGMISAYRERVGLGMYPFFPRQAVIRARRATEDEIGMYQRFWLRRGLQSRASSGSVMERDEARLGLSLSFMLWSKGMAFA